MLIRPLRQTIGSTSYVLRIQADETLRIVHAAIGIKKPFIRYPNRSLSLLSWQIKTVFPIRAPSRSCRPVRYSGRRKNGSFSVTGLSGIVFPSIRDVLVKLYPDAESASKVENGRMQGVMAFNSYVVNYRYTTFHFHEIGMARFNGDHRLIVGNTNGRIECRQSGKRMHRQTERLSTGRNRCCPDREDIIFLQISRPDNGHVCQISFLLFLFSVPACCLRSCGVSPHCE